MGESGRRRNEPRFDLDVKYGGQGELQIGDFLEWIAQGNGRVEVKRKSYLDLKFYIETHHDVGARGTFTPSGISVSTSACWCFVLDDTGIHIAVPTDLIRDALTEKSSTPKQQLLGSVPTRGMLIDFCVLLYRLKQHRERPPGPAPVRAAPRPSVRPFTDADIRW